ncbi:Histone chaperone asf1 [Orchesella cincta]|uniref:Histone chaperone asf1 n=1 Tax=Orchesella cincta TaxID=48709 RepID=A0A1D2MY07_ORCCI|nr:Histone chaperone asf1 [Orchesella cincta]
MAKVHVSNVVVLNNPCEFNTPFQFEITFECIEELKEDLEWKIIYVGSAESEAYDQVLDTVFVGPVPEGRHMFVFQADPPDVSKIPVADAVGVTVVLLTCSYRGKEFVRVGYYVNNEYSDPEMRENPPTVPQYEKLTRNILATQPRVTRFKIEWDDKPAEAGTSGAAVASLEDNSMEQNADSNSSAPTLVETVGFGNGTNPLDYSRCGENNSLIDPSSAMITPGISTCASNDSMSAPMEVI